MAIPSFIFGGDATAKTPQELAQQRAIIHALMSSQRAPKNVGEGLNALGDGIVANVLNRRANAAEAAGQESAAEAFNPIVGALAGFPSAPSANRAASTDMSASAAPEQDAATTPSAPVAGTDWLSYANQAATRNQPLSDKLTSSLGSFLPEMGVTMKVFSGGQDAAGPRRTGSHRHDHGNAADVFFYKDGRQLDWNNPQDLPIFEEIVRRGHAAGITGFGAGEGYMRPGSMHIGFGTPAVWGAGGRGSNAPDWLRQAFNSPARAAPAVAAVNAEAQPEQVASLDPSVGIAQTRQVPLSPGQSVSASPEAQRVISTLAAPQSMTGGAPMPMQPQQVAQAAPHTDLDKLSVMAGGNAGALPPGQQQSSPSLAQLLAAGGNQWLNPNQSAIVKALLGQKLKEMDPNNALETEYKRAQIEHLRNPNAREKFGNSVIWGQDADGNWVAMQPSSGGGLVPADTPDGIKLSPPGVSNLNLGTRFGIRDRNGQVVNTVPIDNAGKASDTALGKGEGEARLTYQSMAAKLPGLEQVVSQLDQLANDATYTTAGQLLDAGRKELGMAPRDAAVARTKYIATVSNQILPLLRDTFGAQFTAREGDTLVATLGDPDKTPAEKQAVLKAFIEQKKRDIEALARQTGQEQEQPPPDNNDPLGIR